MIRLGLIGAGRWGKIYIRTIEGMGDRLKLAQVARSKPENSWKKVATSPEIDAVIIATPAPLHAEMARACLQAGKPCIIEKPLCFDTATAQSLKQLAEKAGLAVLVNYIHLYNPAYRALKEAVVSSGKPVRAILSEGMDLGPFRPDTGTLWDRCPHDVALCLDLMGASGAGADLSAFGAFPDSQGRPEMVTLRLRWPGRNLPGQEGGVTAWIQSGRLSPQKKRTLSVITDRELFHFNEHSAVKCRRIPFDFSGRAGVGNGPLPKEGTPLPVPDRPTPMEAMLAAFADQLEKKAPPTGLGLTVELTRLLEECDKLLASQNKERSCAS